MELKHVIRYYLYEVCNVRVLRKLEAKRGSHTFIEQSETKTVMCDGRYYSCTFILCVTFEAIVINET